MSGSPPEPGTPPAREAPAALRRVLAAWHRAECVLAVAAFATVALVLVLDVLGRELLHPLLRALGMQAGFTGLFGAAKIALYALAVATYAGLGVAAATGSHIVPRAGFALVPASWASHVDRVADGVTAAILIGAAVAGAQLVAGSRALELRAPLLQWPLWWVQCTMPLGFASAALRHLCFALWPAARPPARRHEA